WTFNVVGFNFPKTENHWPKFTCSICKKTFTRKNNLIQHMKKHEDENNHHCPECLRVFTRRDALDAHFMQHAGQSGGGSKRTRDDGADSNVRHKKQKLTAQDDAKAYYRMDMISEKRIEKFNSTASFYKISVNDIEIRELPNIIKTLKQIFQSIIDTIAGEIPSSDKVIITMDSPFFVDISKMLKSTRSGKTSEHFNAIIYEGQEDGIPIYLYSHNEHFDVITTVVGFLNRGSFCVRCKKGYSNKEKHACNNPCVYCHRIHEDDSVNWEYCGDCNRYFVNTACFAMHKQNHDTGTSTCCLYYKCRDCGQAINMRKHKKPHVCNETYCKTCKDFVEEDHQCFMQPVEEDEPTTATDKTKDIKYIFFYFECTQNQQLQCEKGYLSGADGKCVNCNKANCGSFKHQPNLCGVQRVCTQCLDSNLCIDSECKHCGKNELVFKGKQTTQQFCRWLFSEENVGATVVCHNFKGYDSYPILQYLHDNAILPEVITNGTKFMSIKVPVCKIRFIDSMNFIPMALTDMPKAFGITELSKGYFPHLFNREENQTKTMTKLPDLKYYYPDGMKIDKRLEFLAWYDIHKNDAFDLQYELLKYCRSDVDILRKFCLKFLKLFQGITQKDEVLGIDPFEKCLTIASACNLVFRRNFLEHESIGIIPTHGYRPEEKQSVLAYKWLAYLAHQKDMYIQHGRNVGEKQIGPYKVDGYYETEEGEKVVLEMNACFWHGCNRCFKSNTVNSVNDMTMGDLYARTMDKQQYIESLGYTYVSKWECDFKKEIQDVPGLQEFIKYVNIVTPLEPRDAFYGLNERTLYCDTDSIIFSSKPGQWKPPLGDYLGDMTDEVSGNKITNFVTGGSKNNAYKTERCDKNGYELVCKVKGIMLNFKNSLKINYAMVVDMIRGASIGNSVQVADMKICRDIANTKLVTRQEIKDYRIVFDKRIIDKDYLTYPYGY
ncbi:ZN641-like protein, partial [Mya arenaria]